MRYSGGNIRALRRKNKRWVRRAKKRAANAGKSGQLARIQLQLLRDSKQIYSSIETSEGVIRQAGLR